MRSQQLNILNTRRRGKQEVVVVQNQQQKRAVCFIYLIALSTSIFVTRFIGPSTAQPHHLPHHPTRSTHSSAVPLLILPSFTSSGSNITFPPLVFSFPYPVFSSPFASQLKTDFCSSFVSSFSDYVYLAGRPI